MRLNVRRGNAKIGRWLMEEVVEADEVGIELVEEAADSGPFVWVRIRLI